MMLFLRLAGAIEKHIHDLDRKAFTTISVITCAFEKMLYEQEV